MTVRTLAIKLIVFAFTLVLSYDAPKPGSACVRPHPTRKSKHIRYLSRENARSRVSCDWGGNGGRTASEEAILGQDSNGVDDEDDDWNVISFNQREKS